MTIIQKGEPMSDLISRKAAIDAPDVLCQEHRYKIPGKGETYSQYNEAWQDALDRAEGAIGNLPPAEPIRGKWIRDGHHIRCDQCGMYMCDTDREGDRIPTEFCPNCGAKMEVKT